MAKKTGRLSIVKSPKGKYKEPASKHPNRQRTTKVENDIRVHRIARLLCNAATRSDCIQYASEQWGVCSRTCDSYIKKAREMLCADWEIDRRTFTAQSLSELASLQQEARRTGQYNIALGCINTAAKIVKIYD